jgi:hypothetical protein
MKTPDIEKYAEAIIDVGAENDAQLEALLTIAIEEARADERENVEKEYRELTIPALCEQARANERKRITKKLSCMKVYSTNDKWCEGYMTALNHVSDYLKSSS